MWIIIMVSRTLAHYVWQFHLTVSTELHNKSLLHGHEEADQTRLQKIYKNVYSPHKQRRVSNENYIHYHNTFTFEPQKIHNKQQPTDMKSKSESFRQ
jgi:hypothetical protein